MSPVRFTPIIFAHIAMAVALLSATTSQANALPLDQWKSIMRIAEREYNKGNIQGACGNATNLAFFMNQEEFKVRQSGNEAMAKDVLYLMWDWQTYVGKYCGGRPLNKKSALWSTLDRL